MAVLEKAFVFHQCCIENRGKSVVLKSSVQENKEMQAGKTTFFLSLETANSFTVRSATPQPKRILSVEKAKFYHGSIHDTSNAAN